jgi:4'-phosphopantetheinyl transferase EntD
MIQERADEWATRPDQNARRCIEFRTPLAAHSDTRARLVVARLNSLPTDFQSQRRAGHALLRQLARDTLAERPLTVQVSHSTSGRPSLVLNGTLSPFSVSIAHSKQWLAVSLAWNCTIGVDVECASQRKRAPEIARWLGWPDTGNDADQFFRQWVLWEACAKCARQSLLNKRNPGFSALQAALPADGFGTTGCWAGWRDHLDPHAHAAMAVTSDGAEQLICRAWDPENPTPWPPRRN